VSKPSLSHAHASSTLPVVNLSCVEAAQRVEKESPLILLKACKNDAELRGMRACHLRDGAAVAGFLCWLEGQFSAQDGAVRDNEGSGERGSMPRAGSGGGSTVSTGTGGLSTAGISEVALADKLQSFRAQCDLYLEPSFATIAGVNENGAIIHYR
jgi:Xaa-Pro aminopeptidase